VRAQLREVVLVVLGEMERLAMFDVFRLLTDEVKELSEEWRGHKMLTNAAAALSEKKLADHIKETLRVPLVVLVGPGADPATRRRVLFLPQHGITYESVASVDALTATTDGRLAPAAADLPFWNVRARRSGKKERPLPAGVPSEVVDRILERGGGAETAAELELLRVWFSPDPTRALLDHELRAAGVPTAEPPPPVRSVVFAGEIANPGPFAATGGAHELLGRVAREARGFLEAYETSLVQVGQLLALSAFERPPFRTRPDEGLTGATRFARELMRAALEHGVVVHGAICGGEGDVFVDANGHAGLASPALARAYELLLRLRRRGAAPILSIAGAQGLVLERVQQRLAGWKMELESDCAVFSLPET
jgi:hypothetical protein